MGGVGSGRPPSPETIAARMSFTQPPTGPQIELNNLVGVKKAALVSDPTVLGGGGSGDVVGPSSAVNNRVAFFDGTTGKLIKDSGLTISGTNTGDQTISDATISFTDITTGNSSTSNHGFLKKLSNTSTEFMNGAGNWAVPTDSTARVSNITFIISGGGSAITTGVKGYIEVPFACTINQVTTLLDISGSIVLDLWKDTYANYPPTVADTITASAKPTISSGTKAQDSTLTGWTTSISAGDILGFNVDSVSTSKLCTVSLKVTKT